MSVDEFYFSKTLVFAGIPVVSYAKYARQFVGSGNENGQFTCQKILTKEQEKLNLKNRFLDSYVWKIEAQSVVADNKNSNTDSPQSLLEHMFLWHGISSSLIRARA